MSENRLKKIPANAFRVFNYTRGGNAINELDLSDNKLEFLDPAAFSDLSDMRFLDLSCNNLAALPTTIFKNTNGLQALNLSFNKLKLLDDLVLPRGLLQLILSHNQLTNLSADILKKSVLHGINLFESGLTNNQIETLAKELDMIENRGQLSSP